MNTTKFMNQLIQGLIMLLLLFNVIKNNTLSLFELMLTLVAVGYNLFADIIDEKEDEGE